MRIVITGALGHIGSRLIRDLPARISGTEIVMIDNLKTSRYGSLFHLPPSGHYRFIEADILDLDLCRVFQGADAVVHLAAITDATSSFRNRDEVERVNYEGTAKVAGACMETGCPLIHMSSTSVYGTQKDLVDEDSQEGDLNPQSPYAETKLKEEQHLLSLGGSGTLRFVILRNGTIYGISPGMRFHTAVNKFCWQAVMGQPLTVWRTALHQKRPYLDLRDAVEAIVFVVRGGHYDGRIYNVLSNNLTVHDIITHIESHIQKINVQYVDSEIMNQMSYEVANARFQELGFVFRGDLQRGIGETIDLLKGANRQRAPER